ncbi:MAG: DUF2239 family protein [Bryobacterales bacterium]|nr:DUF2239 family protein [Bryobacterales bacterium]
MNTVVAFAGTKRIAEGTLAEVSLAAKRVLFEGTVGSVLLFDCETGQQVDIDYRAPEEVAEPAAEVRKPGRPKLGVVAREVTLLPRHWEWLGSQPGGASVALRKLVEEAGRKSEGPDRVRKAREAVYRFVTAMAGNEPGYEEALRALFAGDGDRFRMYASAWPADVRDHACGMAGAAFVANDEK